mgnify:FL=1
MLGDPHPEDESRTSYHSQISSVFKVEGKKDLYIAVADRWAPQEMEVPYETYAKFFDTIFDEELDREEKEKIMKNLMQKSTWIPDREKNTSIADYVWLPFRFDGEMAYLDWKDEWRIEDYE